MAQDTEKEAAGGDDAAAAEKPPARRKGGGLGGSLLSYALQFTLMLAAVVAGGFINGKLSGGAHPVEPAEAAAEEESDAPTPAEKEKTKAPPKKEAAGPAHYYALDPPLVVNLNENGAVRYLQVNVDVMTRDPKVVEAVQQNAPLIRNDLVALLSDRPPAELLSRDGREKARQDSQAAVNAILEREAGGAQIESLLFTGFVVQ